MGKAALGLVRTTRLLTTRSLPFPAFIPNNQAFLRQAAWCSPLLTSHPRHANSIGFGTFFSPLE